MNNFSYAFGIVIGQQIMQMGVKNLLDIPSFSEAISDLKNGNPLKISEGESQNIVNTTMQENAANTNNSIKEEGIKFLEENKKKPEIHVTTSGLQYEVIRQGNGNKPSSNSTVKCHYAGKLIDGTEFDSSYERHYPAEFNLQQVIKGWTEGVQLMKEGALYRFYIPYELGYGTHGAGNLIPPYATLIFDVELLQIIR